MKHVYRAASALALILLALTLLSLNRAPLPRRWTEVRPGWLFRSAQIQAADVATVLRDQRIDLVVDLTDDESDPDFAAEAAAAHELGIRYLHAPVTPVQAEAVVSYAHAVAAIVLARRRGDRVLVHCEIGSRRSAAAVALYARLVEQEPPSVAYRELYRFEDSSPSWEPSMQAFLEQNLPELDALVGAELEEFACASRPACS